MKPGRYVCVHGHFYQPPRENPWLESIEAQDSARPYHDWNERITAECYAPNASARVIGRGVARLSNNYARISFNFGPTLMSWLMDHAPTVHHAIIAADRESQDRFGGHGSGIAQAYNHAILPLCSPRDRRTQVRWGKRDFEHRFGRAPEGMWLPETAVCLDSLEALVDEGITFTILAPRQATAVRKLGDKTFTDVSGGAVDPSMAYRVELPSGRSIAVFFYDGPISQGIAFEGLLHRGEYLAHRLTSAFRPERGRAELVHVATDGETYGHHHRHGEMALAYALAQIEAGGLAELTNYGQFLERHPPTHEAKIAPLSSWSCVHGVERWRSDCGCGMGGAGDQSWRKPLREAFDGLRDGVARGFAARAPEVLKDPEAAREAYIDVILDRSPASVDAFLGTHLREGLGDEAATQALVLLEAQRHAMLMYTSCGWFFDDVGGLEATQVMAYAARAVDLTRVATGEDLEPPLVSVLATARSNHPSLGDAGRIYQSRVAPGRVDLPRLAAHWAMTALFEAPPETMPLHAYVADLAELARFSRGQNRLVVGEVRLASTITREARSLIVGALSVGDHELHAGAADATPGAWDELHASVGSAIEAGDVPRALRALDRKLGELPYSLRSLLRDEQLRVALRLLGPTVEELEDTYQRLYERHAPVMRFLASLRIPLPRAFLATSEVALNAALRAALDANPLEPVTVRAVVDEARGAGAPFDEGPLSIALRARVAAAVATALAAPLSIPAVAALTSAAEVARLLPFPVGLWDAESAYFGALAAVAVQQEARAAAGDGDATLWMAAYAALGQQLGVTG